MSEPKIGQVITAYTFLHRDNGNVTVQRQQTIVESDDPKFLPTTVVDRTVEIDHHDLFQAIETVAQNNDLNRLMDEYSKMKSLDKAAKALSEEKQPDPILEEWAESGHKSQAHMLQMPKAEGKAWQRELDAEEIIDNFRRRQPDNFVKASEKRIIQELVKHINERVMFPIHHD